MKNFYEYLISINQNWIEVNNEGVILTSSEQCFSKRSKWTGIFETNHLQKNTLYKITNLIKKEEEKNNKIKTNRTNDTQNFKPPIKKHEKKFLLQKNINC